mmetsp:Transcript_13615/g.42079  ORF Transcript_13615/g.42079 Transcript_13615/m.42079 type:complete len:268 (-) Transcript_13615:63-866(-)
MGSLPFQPLLPQNTAMSNFLLDAGIVLILTVFLSYSFTALYWCSATGFMYALVGCAFAIPPAALSLWVARSVIDWLSVVIFAWNIGGSSSWLVLYKAEHAVLFANVVANPALIVISVSLAWPFLCLAEFSLWATVLCLVVWDFFAVDCFIGPFRLVMLIRQQRTWISILCGLPPGLIYETTSGFSLGSGDVLIFGVIIGRASMRSEALAITTGLGVLLGQSINVVWTAGCGGLTPALPVALGAGASCCVAAGCLICPATRSAVSILF